MRLLVLDERDTVAIAGEDLGGGTTATIRDRRLVIRDTIPQGHKVAIDRIASGAEVIRYGEVIGVATQDVVPGEHVHVHNLMSTRARK